MRTWLILILYLSLSGCPSWWTKSERVVVLPSERVLTETRPGYLEISKGYLAEILKELERCTPP